MRFMVVAGGVLLTSAFVISRCGSGASGDTTGVVRGEAVRAVYGTGVVEPVLWAKLGPYKTGRVTTILHDEGSEVKKGDAIAQMDSEVEEGRLREAQARLEFMRKELERKRTLVAKGAVSSSQFDTAEREFREAQARVDALRSEVVDLKLITPIDGVVLRRDVEPGETVQAGETVFWIGQPKPLRVTADVDEEDIGQVKMGQKVLIKADAFPGQVFEGQVSEVTPKGDPVNKVFRIRVSLPNESPLMVSMTTEVNVITDTVPDALLIPAGSERDGKVWKVGFGGTEAVPVKIGIRGQTQWQVLEGLEEGDTILREPPAGKK